MNRTVSIAGQSTFDSVTFGSAAFVMGTDEAPDAREAPAHEVRLSPFAIAKRCVTAAEFAEFMDDPAFDPSTCDYIDPCFVLRLGTGFQVRPGCEQFPMVQITFWGCAAYCNWRSVAEGLDPVYDLAERTGDHLRGGYRLPTEAEWEFACRQSYSDWSRLAPNDDGVFNYRDAQEPVRQNWASVTRHGGFAYPPESPVPVGSLPPAHNGTYEMLGNIREWCHDIYGHYSAEAVTDPAGAARGFFRVVRGGSYLDDAAQLHPLVRAAVHEENKCTQYGFRMARSL